METHPWEDNLLERKVESDLKDLLKTMVAFANSVKPGHIATILIGEKNDGSIAGVINPDNIQKKVRETCDNIYPPILWRSTVYEKEKKFCVRIEIENSGDTPHFGGLAWVRKGSETIIATDDVFQKLIDIRSGLVFELTKWLNKEVTVCGDTTNIPDHKVHVIPATNPFFSDYKSATHRNWAEKEYAKIVFINRFWITFERKTEDGIERVSESIEKIALSYDNEKDQLIVIAAY